MFQVDQKEFEDMVSDALDSLPERYQEHLNNVVIVVEDLPTAEQRKKLHLHDGMTLFGLYEGVPLTRRGNYTMALPDKITIFKQPIEAMSTSKPALKEQIRHTVWHEVAHYYGLDHHDINEREAS